MAAKWTIDNLNKLFIVKAGITELDVEVDLYSDWKEEYKLSVNAGFPPAMRSIGGDPVTAIQNAGATFFMINGWRIRPDEANHTLNINGNLFTDPAGDSVVVNTVGAFNVRVEMFVSNLIDSAVARLDLTQLLQAVWIDTANGVPGTDIGIGTPTNPSNNITDARTIADRDNLSTYKFRGPLVLNANHSNWSFLGVSSVVNDELDLNGFDIGSTVVRGAKCTGTCAGQKQHFVECDLNGVGGLHGFVERCWLRGSLSGQASGEIVFKDCGSAVPGTASPIYTMSANEQFNQRNYSGGWEHRNSTAGCVATIEADPGNITLTSTNVGGVIVLRGIGTFTDNSAGATVNTDGFNPWSTILQRLERIVRNRRILDQADGKLKVLDDASLSVLLEALAWEDAAGTQPYRGQGVERTDRLEAP